jgi:hypothetical protein
MKRERDRREWSKGKKTKAEEREVQSTKHTAEKWVRPKRSDARVRGGARGVKAEHQSYYKLVGTA